MLLISTEVNPMEDKKWEYDLEEYIRQGGPELVDKSEAWKTAI